ncbi:hypothetical protein CEXT_286211 [Caerostris extrusa]|uniref:Secreted protein n=1 Tax=Caerostris extrusa TaxID=172846 RepID=A0AAV4VJD0_CAEEX|nr:hypothetical protein CEXT_286211 [Caerostris extrusa]
MARVAIAYCMIGLWSPCIWAHLVPMPRFRAIFGDPLFKKHPRVFGSSRFLFHEIKKERKKKNPKLLNEFTKERERVTAKVNGTHRRPDHLTIISPTRCYPMSVVSGPKVRAALTCRRKWAKRENIGFEPRQSDYQRTRNHALRHGEGEAFFPTEEESN